MRIARVFPRKTSFSPSDPDVYFSGPNLFTPEYDEIHVSCTFTWDKPKAEYLASQWESYGKVLIGGPAYNSPCDTFTPGMYVRPGVVFTTRGCPNKCSFCFVPRREGELKELPIYPGNIIQDNNILAASKKHLDAVFTMLKTQKDIEFKGGLEARLITPEIAERMRGLKIRSLWLACDTPAAFALFSKAVEVLKKAGFTRSHIYCYIIIGKDMAEEEARLREIFKTGAMPFAQLYKDETERVYSKDWKDFQRNWSRPAIIKAMMKEAV